MSEAIESAMAGGSADIPAGQPEVWAVLKTTFDALDVPRAVEIVSHSLGIPRAGVRLKQARGILLRGLARSVAEATAQELSAAGMPVIAVPDALASPLPAPYSLHAAGATSSAFLPVRDVGGQERVPWDLTRVIVVGRVRITEQQPGGSQAPSPLLSSTVYRRIESMHARPKGEKTHMHDRLLLIGGSPLQHYRIDAGRFRYADILPHPAPVADANFCLLVNGLLRMATGALTNLQPEHIGADGGLALEVFEDPRDLDAVAMWLLALSRVREWQAVAQGAGSMQPAVTQAVTQTRGNGQ